MQSLIFISSCRNDYFRKQPSIGYELNLLEIKVQFKPKQLSIVAAINKLITTYYLIKINSFELLEIGIAYLEVSKLGFGCMGLSGLYNDLVFEDIGIIIIKYAFSKGITFFDTVDVYGANANKILVGKPQELDMEYIDLYYQRRVCTSIPIEETVVHPRFTEDGINKNKIQYARVASLVAKYGCLPAQLAFTWINHQGDDVIPIPARIDRRAVLYDFVERNQAKVGRRELAERKNQRRG
ncbi:hypothetical protein Scep_009718 [Stephania cephalantha]|uniref:NADP-dependent oxidoreductase domain-containing protein n=1 Tax=Stephania cephalantha TaxID=152367 RepID=A0AAP0JTS0_9MAGN